MAKVLVVDDEPMYRKTLQEVLSAEGHNVEIAADGRSAIEIGQRFDPDVLIADWILQSSLSGLEVSEALRVTSPGLRTIIITGFPAKKLRVAAKKSGVFAFLEKPFELDVIRETVRSAMRRETLKR